MKILFYSLPLFGNQFKGNCHNFSQFSAKFQIWAKNNYGIDETESLSLWFAGTGRENSLGLGNEADAEKMARSVISKIPNEGIIDLTDID